MRRNESKSATGTADKAAAGHSAASLRAETRGEKGAIKTNAAVSLDEKLPQIPNVRMVEAGRLLPSMVRAARRIFPACETMRRTAVLTSWAALSGINGWTPEMVDRVERELAK